ncbi:hypothetical protein CH330_04720 [candidate division WOR-3 bacterium JGI_Cruoil_03_51_56]|uniref:TonB-dependent receptor plug domain-containing protein n=1 Tax=candidate division WOR-3 bacterium JGI_Cruoil_03_51_56 TaxID=1973747 RepID=A0A235BUC0_UNCW3|nr:MAG: hypothetical protein CH330_04720 [candidate division WOR-3 bacterium JGI_Cruoil_03_51_56]
MNQYKTSLILAVIFLTGSVQAFKGVVLDAWTRQPVPYAEVHADDIGMTTTTDQEGKFEITTRADQISIEVSRVGYKPRTWNNLPRGKTALLYLFPKAIRLKGVTVSAFRTPVSIDQSGPVTVIEQKTDDTNVAELIRTAPSVTGRDYVNFTSIALRGTNTEHTLIALDGIPLNSAQNSTFDLTTLPLILARRIEIGRGGNSALYGSSTVGGLVNIITPEPERLGAKLRTGIGSFGRKHLEFMHTNRLEPIGYLIAGDFTNTDNRFDYKDSTDSTCYINNADFENKGILAKGNFRNGPHRVVLLGEYNITERGAPGSLSWPSDSARRDDQHGITQLAYAFQPSENLRTAARAFYHRFWQNFRDPVSAVNDTHNLANIGVQFDQNIYLKPWAMVMAGLEADKQNLNSTAVGEPSRSTVSAWTQARLEHSGFGLNPIIRFEQIIQENNDSIPEKSTTLVLCPKLTMTFSRLEWFTLFAGIGRSFRAPGFNDLYWPEDMFSYGNPHLKPEWSTNIDIGIRGKNPDFLHYWIGYYYSDLTDLIQWQPDTASRFHPVNIDSAKISGIEMEARLDLNHLGLDGNMNYSIAKSGESRLIYRPEFCTRATFWGKYDFRRLTTRLNLTTEYTAQRFTNPANTDTLPAYLLFHTEASVRFLEARARFGIHNLSDRRYQTIKDYPVPGRNWYAGLELGI